MDSDHNLKIESIVVHIIVTISYIMSLRPTAPDFQPQSTVISVDGNAKDSCVITIPDLDYEFPHTMKAMPLPTFHKITPTKRVWTEMTTSFSIYLKRY